MSRRAIALVPTFNEAMNIERFLAELHRNAPDIDILIIDDNSPDGTADLVRKIQETNKQIDLLIRSERAGLGEAYRTGFRWAMDHGYDYIIQIDADFSHDPADIPRMLAAARNADAVVGCRYGKGGGIVGWSWLRQLVSHFGNRYARFFLGSNFTDLTGGFNLWHRKVLESIDLDMLAVRGYTFQILLKILAIRSGAKIHQLPIFFYERKSGKSKMTLNIAIEAVFKVPLLYWKIKNTQVVTKNQTQDHPKKAA